MKTYLFTVTAEHVKAQHSAAVTGSSKRTKVQQQASRARAALGYILLGDVGKRVYRVDGITQVENDEQRDRRLQA